MNNKTFCILPFVHLYSSTNGELRPCCIAGSFDEKPYLKDGIDKSFNSVQMKRLRQDMMEGKRNPVCNVCYKAEDSGVSSAREMYNTSIATHENQNGYVIPKINDDFSVESNFQYIDVRFSNLCNFKCIMCTHEFSSQWYEDMDFENEEYHKWNSKIINISNNILDELKPHLSKLKKIYFAGGEPLIMKENYELLKFVVKNSIDCSHPDRGIEIYYNTNLSNLSYQGDSYIDYWKQFKKVYISISCDGLGDVGEYQRVGFKTEKLLSNIEILRQNFSPTAANSFDVRFGYGFQYTVTPINVWHIFDFVDFLKEQEVITNENQVWFNNSFGFFALQNLSKAEQEKIKLFIFENLKNYTDTEFIQNIENLVKSMETSEKSEPTARVKKFVEFLDNRNGQNYYEVTDTKFSSDLV